MGKLFASNVVYYAYPMPRDPVINSLGAETAARVGVAAAPPPLIGADDLVGPAPLNHSYRYLREVGRIVPVEPAGEDVAVS